MADWLIERGIGETRAVQLVGGTIVQSRVLIEGIVPAGTVLTARLKRAGRPALAVAESTEYLLPKGAPGVSEGTTLTLEVVREAIPGSEPWKRPLARVAAAEVVSAGALAGEEIEFPGPSDVLGPAGWSDMLDEARSGIVRFAGGELRVSPTPAMTLIDVDGTLPPLALAKAGADAAARAILRHGVGGSIGIDLPTVAGKAERLAIAERVDAVLPLPFERTAVNGFGFLQIVRPRQHASLFELAADGAAFEARALLRQVAFDGLGSRRLAAHPNVIAVLAGKPDWCERLARQIGGSITLRADPALAMSAGHAEPV